MHKDSKCIFETYLQSKGVEKTNVEPISQEDEETAFHTCEGIKIKILQDTINGNYAVAKALEGENKGKWVGVFLDRCTALNK